VTPVTRKSKKVKQIQKISGNPDVLATSLSYGSHMPGITPDSPAFACLVLRPAESFAVHVNILNFCKPCIHITKMNTRFFKYLELSWKVLALPCE